MTWALREDGGICTNSSLKDRKHEGKEDGIPSWQNGVSDQVCMGAAGWGAEGEETRQLGTTGSCRTQGWKDGFKTKNLLGSGDLVIVPSNSSDARTQDFRKISWRVAGRRHCQEGNEVEVWLPYYHRELNVCCQCCVFTGSF